MEQYERRASVEATHWWFVALRAEVLRRLRAGNARGAPLEVLDAGCGTGAVLAALPARWRRVGVDVEDGALRLAARHPGLDLRRADVQELPFADQSFHVVLSLDVLYHEGIDERRALEEMRRVLRPGGRLILQLPAYAWLRSAHDVAARGARRYTAREARRLLREAGFADVRVAYRVALLFPFAATSRLLHRRGSHSDVRPVRRRINTALLLVMRLESLVGRRVRLPFGLSVFAEARATA